MTKLYDENFISKPRSSPRNRQFYRHRGTILWLVICSISVYIVSRQSSMLKLVFQSMHRWHALWPVSMRASKGDIWQVCDGMTGAVFQCTNVNVPLDYTNSSDHRTYQIAVSRRRVSNLAKKKGTVFVNPGGPGGSGTNLVKKGQGMPRILKDQYDIIGFDPRGVKESEPYISCFDSQFDQEVFDITTGGFSLDLPVTMANVSRRTFHQQVAQYTAYYSSLASKCIKKTEHILPYVGTEYFVKDMDYVSRLLLGDDEPINYWGISYGTVIGQYMVKILPPERLGKIVVDGVVDAAQWSENASATLEDGKQDIDELLKAFALSCLNAGARCKLNNQSAFATPEDVVNKIDFAIDKLYENPVPVHALDIPAVATAGNLRGLLFRDMYQVDTWQDLARQLAAAFEGNYTEVVKETITRVHAKSGSQRDASARAVYSVICADSLPVAGNKTVDQVLNHILDTQQRYSHRFADAHWELSLCPLWAAAGAPSSRSRYSGDFYLANGTLQTPLLILSNTLDPITPIAHARAAADRLGDNARLVQQVDGVGHCSINQWSYCTARIVQDYMLKGNVPKDRQTACKVDQKPFEPFEPKSHVEDDKKQELREAWMQLSREMRGQFL